MGAITARQAGSSQRRCACGGTVGAAGECAACRARRLALRVPATATATQSSASRIMPDSSFRHEFTQVPPSVLVDEALRSPGRPLDGDVRRDLEARFGRQLSMASAQGRSAITSPTDASERQADQFAAAVTARGARGVEPGYDRGPRLDLSRVRVHTGAAAARSAHAVDAVAYTVGSDIVFGQGAYQPSTARGRYVLAHELTHVFQQSRGRAPSRLQRIGPAALVGIGIGVGVAAGAIYLGWAYHCINPLNATNISVTFGRFLPQYYRDTGRPVHNRVWDSFGHCWIGCEGTKKCGASATAVMGQSHELIRELGFGGPHDSYRQDTNNQAHGREFGAKGVDCFVACDAAVRTGVLDLSAPEGTCFDGTREYKAPCEPGGPGPGSPAGPASGAAPAPRPAPSGTIGP
jgi:hypothetical protein